MFLRKLFKIGDKAKWLVLELLIVFIGVYLAFLFQGYAEDSKIDKQKEKVLVGLKIELEEFRTGFERFADFQQGKVGEWDSLFEIHQVATYYDWRYIEPQYNFKIIEYALNQEGTDIVDFGLYEKLSKLYGGIKRLEHTERLMTELGMKYNLIPSEFGPKSEQALLLNAENRFHFYKFKSFADDRANILRRISKSSPGILALINEELGPERTREVEYNLLTNYLEAQVEMDFVREIFRDYFPKYSEKEFDQMVEKIKDEQGETSK